MTAECKRRRVGIVWSLAAASCAMFCPTAAVRPAIAARPALEPIVVGSPARIEVFPEKVQLGSARQRMHLAVSGHYADGAVQDLTRAAEIASSDDKIVKALSGVLLPVGNGNAEVTVKVGAREVKLPVVVSGFERPDPVSFHYGTLAVLTKQGCNSGACHGSPSGKAGFRLSLRGYDSQLDIETLVRESFNRRTNLVDPEQSLLLRKPLMQVSHGGGRKLKKSDVGFSVLRDWIAEGCRIDAEGSPDCVRLEVYPRQRVINRPAHTQQLVALAHFSDGSVRDVTPLVVYTSSDEAVATVNAAGLVVAQERGETAILVRFLDKAETASLTFLKPVPGFEWKDPPANNFVDRHVLAKLHQLQIPPSELCSDDEFIRRAYLDVIGLLPTPAETERFLGDTAADRRAKLIDALLDRPELAEFWALKWADLLQIRNAKLTNPGVHKYHRWLVAAFRDNMPYDRFARELLTASGSTFSNPPANYYRAAAETNECTETTSQIFLGVRIQCAKCHNHPFERWTQDNYYGIGAFFSRVQRKPGSTPEEMVVWSARSGEITQPRTGKQMQPWLPLAGPAQVAPEADRRIALADWLVRPDNPLFAKVEVNRIWGHLLGRGIVEPVDDFRDSNPPASAPLLAELADQLVKSGFNRRHVMKLILNSRTYQLSSRTSDLNRNDQRYFSHSQARLLGAEPLLDAVCQVTGMPEKFAGLPAGLRAVQLPSPDVNHEFLKVFGQPARETACQCERSSDSNLSQALQMINGPLVHGKVRGEQNRLRTLAAAGKSNQDIVAELYLAALCRRPSETEMAAAIKHVDSASERMRGLEDVCWAILNTNEFLFQH